MSCFIKISSFSICLLKEKLTPKVLLALIINEHILEHHFRLSYFDLLGIKTEKTGKTPIHLEKCFAKLYFSSTESKKIWLEDSNAFKYQPSLKQGVRGLQV